MEVRGYGEWPSALSAADLFAGAAVAGDLQVDGDDVWFTELRPDEGGRTALVRLRDGERTDVTPADGNCRTRVHEYGGAPYAVRDGVVVGASYADQRWWRYDTDEPEAMTPEAAVTAGLRYADATFVPGRDAFVAVQERHGDGEPTNEVVLVELDGGVHTLVTGSDFVASPRPSPDGRRVAWLQWDHPYMPWDAAALWVGTLDGDMLTERRRLGGGVDASACDPVWVDATTIVWSDERGDAWRPFVCRLSDDGDDVEQGPVEGPGEIGSPAWTFGWPHLAPLADGRVLAVVTDRARNHLALFDPSDPAAGLTAVPGPDGLVGVQAIVPFGDGVAMLAWLDTGGQSLTAWTPTDGWRELASWPMTGVDAEDVPVAEPMAFPTGRGATTHAMVHHPRNGGVVGPDDERPPLLVFIHGGPTSNVFGVPHRGIAYWTSRGFCVADVNYRGSTGYGKAYRNALREQWGVVDVEDVIAVAKGLAAAGIVDGDRMAIRGGSAGGFTALVALTAPDQPFACGTSFYGVADLRMLAAHTHKFESRYLDGLVGPLPETEDRYVERSPLSRTDHLTTPILVLQGTEDEVVPPEQSRAIVAAAAANGVPHAYLEFEGEQHGFRKLEHQVRWHETELAFYGRVMGFTPHGELPTLDL